MTAARSGSGSGDARSALNLLEDRLGVPYPIFSPKLGSVLGRELRRADVVKVSTDDLEFIARRYCGLWGRGT